MATAVKISVESRDPEKNKGTGTKFSRKLRKSGRIPAIIYGHKQPVKTISLSREAVWEMIKKATHLAELEFDGSSETVLVRDVQWDHLGKEIIHLDFARVSASTRRSPPRSSWIDPDGVTAPGVAEGGHARGAPGHTSLDDHTAGPTPSPTRSASRSATSAWARPFM